MLLKFGCLAVVVTLIAVGSNVFWNAKVCAMQIWLRNSASRTNRNAQQGPPGPPGYDNSRFPKFPGMSEAAAPGHQIPEELLIYPDVPLNAFVEGAPINPDDPQQLINAGPEHHTFSDPRGPEGVRVSFRRFFPGREIPREYQVLGGNMDVVDAVDDLEP